MAGHESVALVRFSGGKVIGRRKSKKDEVTWGLRAKRKAQFFRDKKSLIHPWLADSRWHMKHIARRLFW